VNYLTPSQFLDYYDQRRVLELASDTGTPATVGGIGTNSILLTAIRSASSMIDSSVQTGRRYERTQLEDIVTASNAGGATEAEKSRAEPIKRLCADLAYGYLNSRRGYSAAKLQELAPTYADALQRLNELSTGQRILDIDGPKNAGVPKRVPIGTQTTSLTQYNQMFGVFGLSPNTYLYPPPGDW